MWELIQLINLCKAHNVDLSGIMMMRKNTEHTKKIYCIQIARFFHLNLLVFSFSTNFSYAKVFSCSKKQHANQILRSQNNFIITRLNISQTNFLLKLIHIEEKEKKWCIKSSFRKRNIYNVKITSHHECTAVRMICIIAIVTNLWLFFRHRWYSYCSYMPMSFQYHNSFLQIKYFYD